MTRTVVMRYTKWCTAKWAQEKRAQEKRARKKGHGKNGHRKKSTSEKLGKKGTKEKSVFICKLLLLLFNQHLNYSMCIFCGCLLFNLLEI